MLYLYNIKKQKQLCKDGAKIEGVVMYLKIPTAMLSEEKSSGQTWQMWADSSPAGARFRKLLVKQESGFSYLRPGHNVPTATDFNHFAGFDYVEFSA